MKEKKIVDKKPNKFLAVTSSVLSKIAEIFLKILFFANILLVIAAVLFFVIGLICCVTSSDAVEYVKISGAILAIEFIIIDMHSESGSKTFNWFDVLIGDIGLVMVFGGIVGLFFNFKIAIIVLLIGSVLTLISKSVQSAAQAKFAEEERRKEQLKYNGYKCPNCGMQGGHPIDQFEKAASISLLGAASENFGKTYECANCHYKW